MEMDLGLGLISHTEADVGRRREGRRDRGGEWARESLSHVPLGLGRHL